MNMNIHPALPRRTPGGSLIGILKIMGDDKKSQTGQLCPNSGICEVHDNEVEIRDREGLSKL